MDDSICPYRFISVAVAFTSEVLLTCLRDFVELDRVDFYWVCHFFCEISHGTLFGRCSHIVTFMQFHQCEHEKLEIQ